MKTSNLTEKDLRRHIMNFIVTDMQPISCVEDTGFVKLMAVLAPGVKLPCRKTMTTDIEKFHANLKQKLVQEMQISAHISVTPDCWTAKYTQTVRLF